MRIERARTILLCLRYGIGDVVMETPVVETLRRTASHARITALGAEPAVELLEHDPRVDAIRSATAWGLTHRWDEGDAAVRAAIDAFLDRLAPDLVLDPTHAIAAVRDALLARRGSATLLDADRAAEADAVARGLDGVTAIRAAVLAGWGLVVPEERLPRLRVGSADRAFARRFLELHRIRGRAPVGVSPVASLPMKRWPPQSFGRIIDGAVEHYGRPVLLFAGPQDGAGAAVLEATAHTHAVTRVGPLHLRRVAALLERCAAFVCNDTGLMHMAAAVGTPTIAVFGPTAPGIYLPPAAHAVAVGGREIACPHRTTDSLDPPGCWTSDHCLIADRSCIGRASVREVADRLDEALARRAYAPAASQKGNLAS
ncbi:MAG: glycosyltransferase family 9 protein [Gemmatimonadota bacterium]